MTIVLIAKDFLLEEKQRTNGVPGTHNLVMSLGNPL